MRGPSEGIRTPDIVVPNHARYQLRYTRKRRYYTTAPRRTQDENERAEAVYNYFI